MASHVLALVNPQAGSADPDALDAALAALRELADVRVARPDGQDELAEALAARSGRRVVVLGGDGSLHHVVQALSDAGTLRDAGPLGLVPLGTGNDLARWVGLPVDDPVRAARIAAGGRGRPLDLLRDADGQVVVNAFHCGAGAVATQRSAGAKALLGPLGYAVGAVAAGATVTGWPLRVVVDGEVLHDGREPVLMAAVTVGASIGGGTPLAPDAEEADGCAEVVVALATGPLARVAYALALQRGRHLERSDVLSARGRRVEVELTRGAGPGSAAGSGGEDFDAVPVNVDGELVAPVRAVAWDVVPAAWQLATA